MDRPVAVRRTYWNDAWSGWHLDWGAVWVGALAMLIAAVLFSFISVAVGAQKAVDARVLKWADVPAATVIFSVLGAFLASALGAWVAARMSGARLAEPAILHGVAAWLVVMTMVMFLAALASNANSLAGGYLGNMTPPGAPAPASGPVDPNAAIAIRNAAVGSVLGMLIGLMGAVIGAWIGSGDKLDIWNTATRGHYRRADRWTAAGDIRRTTI
ncbi:MAG TPA: hypothetical protein VGT60_00080 [Candidatus Limnocylindria bacterium]|nr:hypothetical protein [Candidatus Limnocylindria bacterium]